mmetsp:Transcript_22113/g.56499  ORF Transcript_22113/g.56499 Transcript_22113/m.56499 type:complete len:211 (+) Transcript_22113:64-696(+)
MNRAASLLRAWAAHIAELPLTAMQNDFCAVDYRHHCLFQQNVIAQGMKYTSLSDCLDVHEHIAAHLPTYPHPRSAFHLSVARHARLLEERIAITYVVSGIAERIHSFRQSSDYEVGLGSINKVKVDLDGHREPMSTWMEEVASELQPLESFDLNTPVGSGSKALLSRGSFCCSDDIPVKILIELLEMHGNHIQHKKRRNILTVQEAVDDE